MSSPQSVDPIVLAVTSIQFSICACGFVMNSFLALVIAKNRQLRPSSCGVLIMWLAVFDAVAEFSLITTPFVLTITGQTIRLINCFYIESYGPCAQTETQWLILLISVDRMYALVWPIRYKNMSIGGKKKYVAVLILTPLILTVVVYEWGFYNVAAANPEKLVFCLPTDFIQGTIATWAIGHSFVLNLITFIVYFLIWLLIKFKVIGSPQSQFDSRVFHSLAVIMTVQFCCWLPVNGFGTFMLTLLGFPDVHLRPGFRMLMQLNKLGQAINLIVLYICSLEFRKAIRKELFNLFGICNSSVDPTERVPIPNQPMLNTNVGPLNNNFV